MVKLRPVGIDPDENIEPHTRIIPDRVQKLTDLYAKNNVEYPWTQTDMDEQIFKYSRTLESSSYIRLKSLRLTRRNTLMLRKRR